MSKPFHLIGLAGPRACGKDTTADLLTTHAGFTKLAFGDALYTEVSKAFGISVPELQHRPTKELLTQALSLQRCSSDQFVARMIRLAHLDGGGLVDLEAPRSPRRILQWWGTEYRRQMAVGYWVTQVSRRIHFLTSERLAQRFVITDCRFANEVEMVRAFGGRMWQITRAGIDIPPGSHQSEVTGGEFDPDAVLNNDHDIRHLQQLVLGEFWAHDAGLAGVKVEITQ